VEEGLENVATVLSHADQAGDLLRGLGRCHRDAAVERQGLALEGAGQRGAFDVEPGRDVDPDVLDP